MHLFCQLNQMVKSKCAPNLSCLHYPYWHFLAVVHCWLEVIQPPQSHFAIWCQQVSMLCSSGYTETRAVLQEWPEMFHCSIKIYLRRKKRKKREKKKKEKKEIPLSEGDLDQCFWNGKGYITAHLTTSDMHALKQRTEQGLLTLPNDCYVRIQSKI